MSFQASNLVTKAFVLKFVELVSLVTSVQLFSVQVFVFIVFLMFRVGDGGDMFHWGQLPQQIKCCFSLLSGTGFMTTPATDPPTTTVNATTTTIASLNQYKSEKSGDMMEPHLAGLPSYAERPENDLVFGVMTSAGYFLITIVLMIGVVMGDRQKYTVSGSTSPASIASAFQMFLFNFFGFLFYVAMGSEQIDAYKDAPQVWTLISMKKLTWLSGRAQG